MFNKVLKIFLYFIVTSCYHPDVTDHFWRGGGSVSMIRNHYFFSWVGSAGMETMITMSNKSFYDF